EAAFPHRSQPVVHAQSTLPPPRRLGLSRTEHLMTSRKNPLSSPLFWLVTGLLLVAAFIVYLKVDRLHMPLLPEQESGVWTVEARIDFTGRNGPAKVTFALPGDVPGFTLVNENFVSRGFGLNLTRSDGQRQGVWTLRRS